MTNSKMALEAKRQLLERLYSSGGGIDGDSILFGSEQRFNEFRIQYTYITLVADGCLLMDDQSLSHCIAYVTQVLDSEDLGKHVYSPTNAGAHNPYDLTSIVRLMNSVTPLELGFAQVVIHYAEEAINEAIKIHPTGTFIPKQDTAREIVHGKINWHKLRVAELINGGKQVSDSYESEADLKKWAEQAFIEYNAALAGGVNASHNQFWNEVGIAFDALVTKAGKAVEVVAGVGLGIVALFAGLALLTRSKSSDEDRRK